jgi:glycosyltransferase involved in cell wall biosynthesis
MQKEPLMRHDRSPVNVLYCESSADGTIGGSHYCLIHLLENLDRSQYEPTVVFYEEHQVIDRFRAAADTVILKQNDPVQWGAEAKGLLGLPVVLARRAVNFLKFLRTVAGNVRFMQQRGIELLHLNNSITRHQDWILASLIAGIPCVVHERGLSASYTFLDRFYAKRVKLIVPMSRWIKDHMVERGVPGDNIKVMYDGLDPERQVVARTPEALRAAWKVKPDQHIIGIVGNIRPWKGQETVVRAMAEVAKVRKDVVCFFVGAPTVDDKHYQERLQRLVQEFGIQDQVRFTGYQKDVPSFVNMMRVLVHASTDPEPFGMVVLEGMAQKKAVIGSRAGGPVEMIVEGETGYTFVPGDAKMLAGQLLELLADPEKTARMGEAGYQRLVREFTMRRYMSEIHGAYRAILGGTAVAPDVVAAPSRNL